jgi:hypothetical protein
MENQGLYFQIIKIMALEYVIRGENGRITGVKYPQEKVRIVVENYPNHTIAECVELSGLSKAIVYKIACEHNIKKTAEWKQKRKNLFLKKGKNTRYQKGNIPENKGRKWAEYMSLDGQKNCLKTCYKMGNIPYNYRPLGSERFTKGGYIEVKTQEPDVFELKHRVVLQQHNGKIPKGYNIQFKDGNRTNCDIENLYMINQHEQVRNNSIHKYPKELQRAIRTVNKLNKLIKKYTK